MPDKEVLALCDELWKYRLVESPELASFCGFHQYDDSWDDLSTEAYERREKCITDFLKRAESVDVTGCSPDVAFSLHLLQEDLKLYLKGAQFKAYLMPINYLEGIHVDCNLTVSYMKFETESDFEKYITRLEKLPQRIRTGIAMLKKGVESGIVMFKCSVEPVPRNIERTLLSGDMEKIGLMKPFTEEHANIPAKAIEGFKTRAKDLLTSSVFPALRELKEYIEQDYLPHTRPSEGISSLADGPAWYQQCLDFHLTCHMTPKEVHDKGLSEVERIRTQILKVAAKEGLGTTLPEILLNITKRQANFFKSREDILAYVRDLCHKKIRPKLKGLFKDTPDLQLKVVEMPDYMSDGPQGYYLNGTPDGSRDGSYYINTSKLHDCYPYCMTALSLHEGEPGHHLQGIHKLASTNLPDFRKYDEDSKYYLSPAKFSFYTAYVEGWGLYSEALGEEMGLYTDSLTLLGRYGFEIFRASRLVVDTGLHAFGWSREKAVQYMIDNNLTMEAEIRSEVDRYITWPGQACAYKIGELKIWELRRKAEKELGSQFDPAEFHKCVLTVGSVSLTVLETVIDKFISESRKH